MLVRNAWSTQKITEPNTGPKIVFDKTVTAGCAALGTTADLDRPVRELSGGKPIGFKLCIGQPHEFFAICKAMVATGLLPDFITIDGKEGGTGSAPLEFMDHIGMPMRDAIALAHHSLIGVDLRRHIRLAASGKITTAFDIARASALGADWCYSARGFMFALGCIQSLKCHTDRCPTGVATQDPARARRPISRRPASRISSS